jgi:hypothetical protein
MENKINYVLALFNKIYGLSETAYQLNYGIDGKSKIQVRVGDVSFFSGKEIYDVNKVVWKEWKSERIPFLFDKNSDSDIITVSNGKTVINFDILASSFFFLSNWQETGHSGSSGLNRFPFEKSIQYQLKLIDKPVVNYYFEILKEAIEKTYDVKLKTALWEDHSIAVFISHDIDTCQSAWLQGGFRAMLKGDIVSVVRLIFLKLFKEDAWFNFRSIVEAEKKEKINSTFFFLPRKGKHGNYRNSDYTVTKKKFRKLFAYLRQSNSEIGVHGSLGTCMDPVGYSQDVTKFPFPVIGNRFHFLEFDATKTVEMLENSNIRFDSTMGFAEHYGFRNGICFPFFLYDIKHDRASRVLEIPLVLMDGTLQNTKYLNIGKDQVESKIDILINEVKKFNGLFTVLWHNTHYSDYKYAGWGKIMSQIIRLCKEKNALFLNGKEIVRKYGIEV